MAERTEGHLKIVLVPQSGSNLVSGGREKRMMQVTQLCKVGNRGGNTAKSCDCMYIMDYMNSKFRNGVDH